MKLKEAVAHHIIDMVSCVSNVMPRFRTVSSGNEVELPTDSGRKLTDAV